MIVAKEGGGLDRAIAVCYICYSKSLLDGRGGLERLPYELVEMRRKPFYGGRIMVQYARNQLT